MTTIREQAARGLRAGDRFEITRTFTREEVSAFAALTRDYNPIHVEPQFAAAQGLRGPVCHGLLVASLLTEIGGQLAWLASGMSFRFRAPVYPGQAVRCVLEVERLEADGRARARVQMHNPEDELVLEAELYGRLPQGEPQAVLREMLDAGDPTNPLG